MANPISRPAFYEGEILPAADLGATVDYARNQMARHARDAHSWGIVTGLELTYNSGTVTLSAGVAIDGTGREIVVPADVQLDPTTFTSDVVPLTDPNAWYPVFLYGSDQAAAPSSSITGACGSGQPTSIQEIAQYSFGSPGSELAIESQAPPSITDGPDGGISGNSSTWLILVGFVQWNAVTFQFSASQGTSPNSAVTPQYVGVNAAQVISGSGSLLLATGPAAPQGQNPVMAVEIQETPAQLVFGKLGTDGTVTPALTVSANGDVTATGKVLGTSIPVSVQVQSGIASDGMILPLPMGIDPSTPIYAQVSIRYDSNLTPPPPSGLTTPIAVPMECTVDPTTRRVSCRWQWWDASNFTLAKSVVAPAACDYVLIAAVPGSSGGGS